VEGLGRHGLDRGLCADGHEDRGVDSAMRGKESAASGLSGCSQTFEVK